MNGVLVATQNGVIATAIFAFLAGSAAWPAAVYIGGAIAKLFADDDDPLDDPRNWH